VSESFRNAKESFAIRSVSEAIVRGTDELFFAASQEEMFMRPVQAF